MFRYFVIYSAGSVLVLASTLIGYRSYRNVSWGSDRTLFGALVLATVAWTVVMSLMKDLSVLSHHSYLDMAVFLEYFDKFSQGGRLYSAMQNSALPGNGHWFANHFTPIAYLFAYAYKLIPSFRVIDWLQTAVLAVSPLLLYRLSRRLIGHAGALCISLALLVNPTFQYITLYEFEFLRFVIPFGILALGLIMTRSSPLAIVLACAAVLLIREDAPFAVVGMGIFIFIFQRDRRKLGAGLILLALVYMGVVIRFVMPLFRESSGAGHVAGQMFQHFGSTIPEIVRTIAHNPVGFLVYLFHPTKTINILMYLLPFSFVPLAGAPVLLVAAPTLALLLYSSAYTHSSYFLYYVSPILVAVTWASVAGLPVLSRALGRRKGVWSAWLRTSPPSVERVAFAVLLGSIVCSVYFGPSPLSLQFWWKGFSMAPFRTLTFHVDRYRPTDHDEAVRKVASLIPTDSAVSTEQFLLSDVHKCRNILVFPWIEGADYVFIDKRNALKTGCIIPGAWNGLRTNPQFYYDWVEKRPDVFELVHSEDGVFLYRRKADAPDYPQPLGAPP